LNPSRIIFYRNQLPCPIHSIRRGAHRESKAWAGMLTHAYADGRLGAIQPVGAAPGAYTETSSCVYAVGAYLLAGSEIYRTAK
jgi:hypothetical protein